MTHWKAIKCKLSTSWHNYSGCSLGSKYLHCECLDCQCVCECVSDVAVKPGAPCRNRCAVTCGRLEQLQTAARDQQGRRGDISHQVSPCLRLLSSSLSQMQCIPRPHVNLYSARQAHECFSCRVTMISHSAGGQ